MRVLKLGHCQAVVKEIIKKAQPRIEHTTGERQETNIVVVPGMIVSRIIDIQVRHAITSGLWKNPRNVHLNLLVEVQAEASLTSHQVRTMYGTIPSLRSNTSMG